jgi:hypothetical protein
MRHRARSRTLLASLAGACCLLLLGGCSADAVDAPEPTVETPGAFVGLEDETNGIAILRTRGTTGLETGDKILIVDVLEARPASFEEARTLARGPDLRVRSPNYFITLRTVLTNPHEVLWFRSLEPGE